MATFATISQQMSARMIHHVSSASMMAKPPLIPPTSRNVRKAESLVAYLEANLSDQGLKEKAVQPRIKFTAPEKT